MSIDKRQMTYYDTLGMSGNPTKTKYTLASSIQLFEY